MWNFVAPWFAALLPYTRLRQRFYEQALVARKAARKRGADEIEHAVRFKFAQCCWRVGEYDMGKQTVLPVVSVQVTA
jgi:hypothetical protein